jgi:uncharacterized damage-inducible protein DinB
MGMLSFTEGKRLSAFSEAVRRSTVKRLRLVPEGVENWRPGAGGMSFADLAHHLLMCDEALFRALQTKAMPSLKGAPGAVTITRREEFLKLIEELERDGAVRRDLFERLSEEHLREHVDDARFGGSVTTWWVIVRGNLDHEIHHRGQISAYLKFATPRV